jgi:hypothetical protein
MVETPTEPVFDDETYRTNTDELIESMQETTALFAELSDNMADLSESFSGFGDTKRDLRDARNGMADTGPSVAAD